MAKLELLVKDYEQLIGDKDQQANLTMADIAMKVNILEQENKSLKEDLAKEIEKFEDVSKKNHELNISIQEIRDKKSEANKHILLMKEMEAKLQDELEFIIKQNELQENDHASEMEKLNSDYQAKIKDLELQLNQQEAKFAIIEEEFQNAAQAKDETTNQSVEQVIEEINITKRDLIKANKQLEEKTKKIRELEDLLIQQKDKFKRDKQNAIDDVWMQAKKKFDLEMDEFKRERDAKRKKKQGITINAMANEDQPLEEIKMDLSRLDNSMIEFQTLTNKNVKLYKDKSDLDISNLNIDVNMQ